MDTRLLTSAVVALLGLVGLTALQVLVRDVHWTTPLGLFAPIDKAAFIEKISNPDAAPRFEDWKVINAQALVTGRVSEEADGRLRAEFRLWDTFAGQQLVGDIVVVARLDHEHARAFHDNIARFRGSARGGHTLSPMGAASVASPEHRNKRAACMAARAPAGPRPIRNCTYPRFSGRRPFEPASIGAA